VVQESAFKNSGTGTKGLDMKRREINLNKFKSFAPFALILCCSLSLAGCGYTTGSTLPAHLKTVHIEPFKNSINYASNGIRNIYLPLLEIDARNEIVNRFLFDGNLKLADKDLADLVLSGELVGYNREGLRFDDRDNVEEYRVRIVVNLKMYDNTSQSVMWQEKGFGGEGTYFVSGSLAEPEDNAVDKALEDLARRVVERTVEAW